MNTSEFDKYKVDHLFLLIGENPLPNYVAAKLLFKDKQAPEHKRTLYLVHTTWTEEPAKRLKNILESQSDSLNLSDSEIQLVSLNEDESDAHRIKKRIHEELENLPKGSIGLNYTGGTKAMSVHSYRALFYEQTDKNKEHYTKRSDVFFSYLDSRRLEICIDREDGERDRIKVTPESLPVDLKTVFELHGWEWVSDPTDKPKLCKAAKAFAELHQQSEDAAAMWRRWCDEVLRPATRDGNSWKSEKELKQVSALSLEILKPYPQIKSALEDLGIIGEALYLHTVKEQGLKKLKHVCEWLDGEWLEHYVLQQVQVISKDCLIHNSATSFWMSTIESKEQKFQFDVAFMRGYQLFALSCTTDSTLSLCKSKLFEAYIRAQQLGGSEARVALVCCISKDKNKKDKVEKEKNNVNKLKTEIINVVNPEPDNPQKDHKLEAFGREDLIELSTKIKTWIEQNEREVR